MNNELDFSQILSESGIVDPVALPGAQEKASARTITTPVARDYILKISPPEYPFLVENEAACFSLARKLTRRVPVSETRIIVDTRGRSGLLVTRFDRQDSLQFHVEDAAQLLNIPPAMKYRPSLEDVARAVANVCASPRLAMSRLAYMTAFAWLTGNGDMHAKNISVIDRGRGLEVAPLYDIPATVAYGDSTMALKVQGLDDHLSIKRFFAFAEEFGLPEKIGHTIVRHCLAATEGAAEQIINSAHYNSRQVRDIRRILNRRRRLWEESH